MDVAGRLRDYLGEQIPAAGSDADTLFTNAQISDIFTSSSLIGPDPMLYNAAIEGWTRKAALLANLVDTTNGGIQRQFSQLHKQALAEIQKFQDLSTKSQRTRTRKIVRAGSTIR